MYIVVPPVVYVSRSAFSASTCFAVWSESPARITVNSTAVPSADGIGPSAATAGSFIWSAGSGNCDGTWVTTSGPSPLRSPRAAFTCWTKAGSCTAPAGPAITNVSGMMSCSSLR